jgi:hypothetical protein
MKTKTNNSDDIQVEELVNQISNASDRFKYLQIFLHRDRKIDAQLETKFLMVTPTNFMKVEITDLLVQDGFIIVEFFDCVTKDVGNVRIKINGERPNVIFINWNDIKSLVGSDICTFIEDSGLLAFDF